MAGEYPPPCDRVRILRGFGQACEFSWMNDNDMGLNLNQPGPLGLMLGQNQIQEATMVANSYSGQFGSLAGTNVNYITMRCRGLSDDSL